MNHEIWTMKAQSYRFQQSDWDTSNPESIINYLYPVELSAEDESDLEALEEFEGGACMNRYEAKLKAVEEFKAKKPHMVSVMLAKKEGKQVTHVADF